MMGYKPIYLIGRNQGKMEELAKTFPPAYELVLLDAAAATSTLEQKMPTVPVVAIATIPADRPVDPAMAASLQRIFARSAQLATSTAPKGQGTSAPTRTLLELAYKPAHTAVMQMAEQVGGWTTVQGLETLVTQGLWQFEFWTGIRVRGLGGRISRDVVLGPAA
ncbi:hypothetical protein CLAIMM_10408 isoform 1 [Cladophialophora immunda]|nr:hypothetical protein CLAIMM_10408 isoform 1 [Cladophialophora immunda]